MKSIKSTRHLTEEQRVLYLSGALSADQRQEAEQHLQHCLSCRASLKEDEAVIDLFGQLKNRQVRPEMVKPASMAVMTHVYQAQHKKRRFWPRGAAYAAVAAALIVGFISGRWSAGADHQLGEQALLAAYSLDPGSVQVNTNVPNKLDVILPNVNRERQSGSMKNREMLRLAQTILTHDRRDDVRLRVMKLIDAEMVIQDQALAQTVMRLVEHDPNPGLRIRAMRLLKKLPVSEELIAVLKRILLKDDIEGLRVEAANYLINRDFEAQAGFIRQIAGKDAYMKALMLRSDRPLI